MALLKIKPILNIHHPILTKVITRNLEASCPQQNASPKFSWKDKVAVVTGGASGIGFAIAKEFLQQGLSVVNIIDNDRNKLEERAATLKTVFGEERVISSEADVGDTEQMDKAFRNCSVHFHAIDIIVNNAGILDDFNWENQLNTNLKGTLIGTLLGMQYMAKSSSGDGGVIVNVGSTMSVTPCCGFPIYSMTQFGIAGFTRALGSGKLFKRTGVKVIGYCPGLTCTDMLKKVADKAINDNFAGEFQEQIKDKIVQDPAIAAQGLVEILGEAKPGSIWIAENNKSPFELEFPETLERKAVDEQQQQQQPKQGEQSATEAKKI